MFKIRKGTFETNSSSTHTIVVTKDNSKLDIPNEIKVDLADYEFGWEYDKYYSVEEKLAYLVFGILSECYWMDAEVGVMRLIALIKKVGEWVNSVKIYGLEIISYDKKPYFDAKEGYVDHASEMDELLDAVLQDEELLKRYLFSTNSYIATGNDNEDGYPDIYENYEYDTFFKGN